MSSVWAPNASLISICSTSARLIPVALHIALVAGTGPIPIIVGSQPDIPYPTILASGTKPLSSTASSLATEEKYEFKH